MSSRDDAHSEIEPLQSEAIDWVVRLGLRPPSAEDERALAHWRAQSPDHEAAWRGASSFADELRALPLPGVPRGAPTALPLRRRVDRRAVLWAGGGAIAASVAWMMVVDPPAGLWPSWAELTAQHRTGPGQTTAFTPSTGVDVELNTRTSVSLADGGGGINLINGETLVTVQNQPKAFVVHAADGLVASEDGVFSVRHSDADLCLTCVSGEVVGRRGGQTVRLAAGEQAVISPSGAARQARVDPALALAWRRGLLIFHGTPLTTAIAEINRYYPGRLILADQAVAGQPISGVFHIHQIETAVVQIQQLAGVGATRLPGGVVLLG